MGKRKSRKKIITKAKDPGLPTTFDCPFCIQTGAVLCTMKKDEPFGRLRCRICDVKFQAEVGPLSAPVDVYNEWIDACATANAEESEST